jgi:tRNA-specific 2-thiouridylase
MKKILLAISGGIDSITAGYILKKKNFKIIGIHFINSLEKNNFNYYKKNIQKISSKLNIHIKIIDIKQEFKKNVINYFLKNYCEGKTPNPCIICNKKIKFGLLIKYAKILGINNIATGHYVKKIKNFLEINVIKRNIDKKKDQSYFLSRLKSKQLINLIFPLGNMKKKTSKKNS